MTKKNEPEAMKELHYKIYGVNEESIESDSVEVGDAKSWAEGQHVECSYRGWTIHIWDNDGNTY